MQFRRRFAAWLASAASIALLAGPNAAAAQSAPVVSRPVVQSLPSADSRRLNAALARIAKDPRDVDALVDAGDAANALGDPEAAVGFYKRADAIASTNPRVKAGMARALVLQGEPVKAIPLFAQAEAGGASGDVTSDRGLAYDLVGDTATAQTYYRTAMARQDGDEVRRRLGISLAIAGDAAGSEAMLMPLLRKQDKPAWRSHAFALAIAGRTKEAVDTVNAILPGPLAQSVTPYLRYMPRLTRAQQAAAANLGKFPRASEIGRDDPAIAAYAPTPTRVAQAGSGLIPQGKPLGGGAARIAAGPRGETLTRSQRRAQERATQLARAEAARSARVAPPEPRPTINRDTGGELPPISGSAPAQALAPTQAAATQVASAAPMRTPAPTAAQTLTRSPQTSTPTAQLPSTPTPTRVAAAETARTATSATTTSPAPASSSTAAGGFDLARVSNATSSSSAPVAASAPTASLAPSTPELESPPPSPVSLEKIFADLGAPSSKAVPVAGAVDILSVVPAKPQPVTPPPAPEPEKPVIPAKKVDETKPTAAEKKKADAAAEAQAQAKKAAETKAAAKKAADAKAALEAKKAADAKKAAEAKKAAQPSRIWVQIGVGRDMKAIAFDWRKFNKDYAAAFKGRDAYTSDMGQTNRVLVGPFATQKAASAFLAELKKADFARGFIWTSPAGQAVDPLGAK